MAVTSTVLREVADLLRSALQASYDALWITVRESNREPAEGTPGLSIYANGTEQTGDQNGLGVMRFRFSVAAWTQNNLDPSDQAYVAASGTDSPQALCETAAQALNNEATASMLGPVAKSNGPTPPIRDEASGMWRSESDFWCWVQETW